MRYCKRCVYPANHPLNILFDEQGVCSGCRIHEEKDRLDWVSRGQLLKRVFESYRSTSKTTYDCIVPVSGGRDSYFIVDTVKNKYGMNPLLVSYNRHYNTRRGLRNLAYLRTLFNCDTIEMVVDPAKVKRITRQTLRKFGSMHWATLAGETVFPVQAAVRFKIPLIVWGVHQGVDQVGMFSHTDEVEMTRRYRKEHDLLGFEAEDLIDDQQGVSELDVMPFTYPHDRELEKSGVRGIYLGNYIRWDSKAQHEKMIGRYGYESAKQQRTFDCYQDVHCQHYSGIHDYIKFLKWGFGKASDHAAREIRLRRLNRTDAIRLIGQYENVVPTDLPKFLSWLDMSAREFYGYVNSFRDLSIWHRPINGDWVLRDSITNHENDEGADSVRLDVQDSCEFVISKQRANEIEDEYVLLHKGFVEKDVCSLSESQAVQTNPALSVGFANFDTLLTQ